MVISFRPSMIWPRWSMASREGMRTIHRCQEVSVCDFTINDPERDFVAIFEQGGRDRSQKHFADSNSILCDQSGCCPSGDVRPGAGWCRRYPVLIFLLRRLSVRVRSPVGPVCLLPSGDRIGLSVFFFQLQGHPGAGNFCRQWQQG